MQKPQLVRKGKKMRVSDPYNQVLGQFSELKELIDENKRSGNDGKSESVILKFPDQESEDLSQKLKSPEVYSLQSQQSAVTFGCKKESSLEQDEKKQPVIQDQIEPKKLKVSKALIEKFKRYNNRQLSQNHEKEKSSAQKEDIPKDPDQQKVSTIKKYRRKCPELKFH